MENISRFDGDNMPGIQLLEYLPINYLLDIQQPPVDNTIQLTTLIGYNWLKFYSTIEKTEIFEESKHDAQGQYTSVRITGFLPKDLIEYWDNLRKITVQRFLVRATDNAGQMKLYGDVINGEHRLRKSGLRFSSSVSKGPLNGSTIDGREFSFYGVMKEPPRILLY